LRLGGKYCATMTVGLGKIRGGGSGSDESADVVVGDGRSRRTGSETSLLKRSFVWTALPSS
jgi:hypothetical protein